MFTKKGQKVAILEDLKDGQFLVQEVYMDDNDKEVLAGDKWVARDLHDTPPLTYQEKQMEKHRIELSQMEQEVENEKRNLRNVKSTLRQQRRAFASHLTSDFEKVKEHIYNVLTGEYKYAVQDDRIIPIDEFLSKSHHGEMIKLVSLFGSSEGDLEYRLFRYSDGSGGGMPFTLHTTLKSAKERVLKYMKNSISNRVNYSYNEVLYARNHDIPLDREKLNKLITKLVKTAGEHANSAKHYRKREVACWRQIRYIEKYYPDEEFKNKRQESV